jgi:hypothetical protein
MLNENPNHCQRSIRPQGPQEAWLRGYQRRSLVFSRRKTLGIGNVFTHLNSTDKRGPRRLDLPPRSSGTSINILGIRMAKLYTMSYMESRFLGRQVRPYI